ncbi:MAG TPA: ornithine cyclodeaminase family protein [Pyrinomonadaceae bacterium]|nr:ornithine cyclodeaminase family protein [Pyrinomonadaceae bacterium]
MPACLCGEDDRQECPTGGLEELLKLLVVDSQQITQLLPMAECIELMSDALASLARGEVYQPLRTIIRPPDARGLLGLMPAYRHGEHGAFGLKAICVFPGNPSLGKDAHQGTVMLFSQETGEPLALMNASQITAIRTAAVSAVATRLLARPEAEELGIIGAGVQARTHLLALACVRSIKRARVACRNNDHAMALVREMQDKVGFTIESAETNEAAVRGADLIVTATSAHEPVIKRDWIADGAHINAIGTHSPQSREIDSETMAAARIFVDRRESALNEAGDYLLAAQEGAVTPESIVAEIGELVIQSKQGRAAPHEITLFKSLGLAIEDVVCAEYLFRKAKAENTGTWVDF